MLHAASSSSFASSDTPSVISSSASSSSSLSLRFLGFDAALPVVFLGAAFLVVAVESWPSSPSFVIRLFAKVKPNFFKLSRNFLELFASLFVSE
jgi:hypothetical protein